MRQIWQGRCWDGWEDFDSEEECVRHTKSVLGDEWDASRVRAVWLEKAPMAGNLEGDV